MKGLSFYCEFFIDGEGTNYTDPKPADFLFGRFFCLIFCLFVNFHMKVTESKDLVTKEPIWFSLIV